MVYVRLHAVSRAVVRSGGRAPSGDWFGGPFNKATSLKRRWLPPPWRKTCR